MERRLLEGASMPSLPSPGDVVRDETRDPRGASRTPCEHSLASRRQAPPAGVHAVTSACVGVIALIALGALLTACAAGSTDNEGWADEADLTSVETEADPTTPPVKHTQTVPVAPGTDAGPAADAGPTLPPVTADTLLAKLATCATKLSTAPYSSDSGGVANLDVCGLTGAVFWKADMDIDCDGKETAACNKTTDPWFLPTTAAVDSKGAYLDSAALPYVVVPGVSTKWSYKTSGIAMGNVVAVIHKGKLEFGIVGDVGPTAILGEASYAMAKKLGINPDPKVGGTAQEVAYIVFTGTVAKVKKNEDQAEAVTLGTQRAQQFLLDN